MSRVQGAESRLYWNTSEVPKAEMDGLETTSHIVEELPEEERPKIIAWTSHDDADMRKKCLEAGMDDFCSKDISANKLKTVLEKWLR